MSIDTKVLQRILEGALLASAKPLTVAQLADLFEEEERPANDVIRAALEDIQHDTQGRGFELKEVSSGFRFQVVQDVAPWVGRLWEEKPQRYSRALLETLALIAYRQPITRGDIEEIRGVAVSSNIIKTLMEREWVRIVGHKDVPGRPAMYATTRRFLDYFNLKSLDELPTLAEIKDLDSLNGELELEGADTPAQEELAANDESAAEDLTSEEPVLEEGLSAEDASAEQASAETDVAETGVEETGVEETAAEASVAQEQASEDAADEAQSLDDSASPITV